MSTETVTVNPADEIYGTDGKVIGDYVELDGESYFRIANCHRMDDFFMSIVGASDHWMFLSSNGALTAGRRDPELALFPYACDDQISVARSDTGSFTMLRLTGQSPGQSDAINIWQPFAPHDASPFAIQRNLYKTPTGTKVVFEEVNHTLQLVFRYRWVFSEQFGFVRSCWLENTGDAAVSFDLLDGLRNVLPCGVGSEFMMRFSNLSNAYKKSDLDSDSAIGMFYLSSIPTDRAEPSEGLRTTTVWQTGLQPNATLISSQQIDAFRQGQPVQTEQDVRGKAGAYLLQQSAELSAGDGLSWHIVAEVDQDYTDVVGLKDRLLTSTDVEGELQSDIALGEQNFQRILSSSDAMQSGSNLRRTNRHLSNTVFNLMRGGVPLDNYRIDLSDFLPHVRQFNQPAFDQHEMLLTGLPAEITPMELLAAVAKTNDPDLSRLTMEYLPLAFSRRHGDPTRPWNRFSIQLRAENGRTNLNYQGNWRDIFQNWEALAMSFPQFLTAMICRFVNATTADGYNPYKVTKDGFHWEEPAPNDPWSNIGYWGDHQIIYLLKLIEWNRSFAPNQLAEVLNSPIFVHANVPYRIREYAAIREDAQSTITFDRELAATIRERVAKLGSDGKLLRNSQDEIQRVTFVEKLLTLSLAKMSNFIPDGGIWLNTQRPEWNDANNALVGSGLSMVTTCYLYRWFNYLHAWISGDSNESYRITPEVQSFLQSISQILADSADVLGAKLAPAARQALVDQLSQAGSDYREGVYAGVSGDSAEVAREDLLGFFELCKQHLAATIRNNRRDNGLYHAYNLLDWRDDGLEVEYLYEMLEGQVAVLSAELLTPAEVADLLDALRSSPLYRANQDSYMLYPDRQLPRFLEKNDIPAACQQSPLVQLLLKSGDTSVVRQDVKGGVHFNGSLRNAADVRAAFDKLGDDFKPTIDQHGEELCNLFVDLFGHRQFTGRSGTFFAYEGLGSIYWHMVSKLRLAVGENFFAAVDAEEDADTIERLREHYYAVQRGIGAEKTPTEYGAFPTDPYSHTPENAGVKQPGMTGQVKEDILSRFAEIGADIKCGCLGFRLELFDRSELLAAEGELAFYDLTGTFQQIEVPQHAFAYTMFQVPIVYEPAGDGNTDSIEIRYTDGESKLIEGRWLDAETSQKLFSRSGEVARLTFHSASLNQTF